MPGSHETSRFQFDDDRLEEMLAKAKARSRRLRARRHRSWSIAIAVLAMITVTGGVWISAGHGGTSAGSEQQNVATGPAAAASRFRAPVGSRGRWKLVANVSTLWHATTVNYSGATLTCPSAGTCYVEAELTVGGKVGPLTLEVTHNGGTDWQNFATPGPIISLSCVDAETCSALSWNSASSTVLLSTTDGGETWSSEPFPGERSTIGVGALSCVSRTSCVAVAYDQRGTLSAMVTDNDGATWSQHALPSTKPPSLPAPLRGPSPFVADDLQCFPGGACVLLGNQSLSAVGFSSTDGGATWEVASVPTHFDPGYNFSCSEADACMAVGTGGGPDRPVVAVSTDGGHTWTETTTPAAGSSREFLNWVSCTGGPTCFVTGGGDNGFVAETANHGAWQTVTLPTGVLTVGNISCPSAAVCYALGGAGRSPGPLNSVFLSGPG